MRAPFLSVVVFAVAFSLYVSAGMPNAPAWLRGIFDAAPAGWLVGPGFYAWSLGLLAIFLGALAFCRPGPELTVASELVVVYGIFGLLSNIASGVLAAQPALLAAQSDWDPSVLLSILTRFADGLLSAGLAPLVAVTLRGIDTTKTTKRDQDRSDELDAAYSQLKESIDNARANMTAAADEFKSNVDTIASSAQKLAASLERSASTAHGLEDVVSKLRAIGPALAQLQDSAGSTATNMGGLGNRTHEAEQMLRALGEAIEKVTNFVRDR